MYNINRSVMTIGVGALIASTTATIASSQYSSEELIALLNPQSIDKHCSMSTMSDQVGRPVLKHEWQAMFDGMMNGSRSISDIEGKFKSNKGKRKAAPQVVYLDFEIGEPTFIVGGNFPPIPWNDYVYSQAEKDEIQRRIEADYAGLNIEFTQEQPTEGPFFTLQFNDNDNVNIFVTASGSLSILFGRANEIDFGNDNFNSAAFADASVWTFLLQLDPSGDLLAAFSGLNPANFETPEDMLSFAVVNQSANTGAHEIGHTLGLRHYDPFGAPGDGLPATGRPSPFAFFPVYDGPQGAIETVDHIMASGASSGITLNDSAGKDRFFSERSLNKLRFNDLNARGKANIIQEDKVKKRINLKNDKLPNNLVTGINAGAELFTRSVVVEGRINELGEVDAFEFKGKRGQIITAEVISNVDLVEDFVFPRVSIFYKEDNGDLTLIGQNDDEFESFDSLLLDLVLPYQGDYVVQVDAPDTVQVDINGDLIPDTVPLSLFGPATENALRIGDYSLHLYSINASYDRSYAND